MTPIPTPWVGAGLAAIALVAAIVGVFVALALTSARRADRDVVRDRAAWPAYAWPAAALGAVVVAGAVVGWLVGA